MECLSVLEGCQISLLCLVCSLSSPSCGIMEQASLGVLQLWRNNKRLLRERLETLEHQTNPGIRFLRRGKSSQIGQIRSNEV